jgi:membrane-associated phospholipid phosphatase
MFWRPGRRLLGIAAVLLVLNPGQTPVAAQSAPPGKPIRLWHAAVAVGLLAGTALLDQPTERWVQRHRSDGADDAAAVFRHMGQPEVFATVGLGTLAAGLITGNDDLARAGGRISTSILLAGAITEGGKLTLGRARPNHSPNDAFRFHPFSGDASFPSGHTTVAFALAASVSDEVHRPWATVLLYSAAVGTGWSRMNDDKHWLSDVVAGAGIGIVSAKLVNGHWRIFNLHPPSVLLGPGGAGLRWSESF